MWRGVFGVDGNPLEHEFLLQAMITKGKVMIERAVATIDEEKCNGCGVCREACPHDAIRGTKKQPHAIAPEKCNRCGICYDGCAFDAVTVC